MDSVRSLGTGAAVDLLLAWKRRPGGVAERLNAVVSKTIVRLNGVPGVRISPPPFFVGFQREAPDG